MVKDAMKSICAPHHTYTHCPPSTHIQHTLTPSQVQHIPTDEIMVLKINKRMNGAKKMKEVELLKRLSHPNILQ